MTSERVPSNADYAVMLLDEIDKAEPDVPNDLLEVLSRAAFACSRRRLRRRASGCW